MSIFDNIPDTNQGMITFKAYAENQIKNYNVSIKHLEMMIAEIDRRLEEREKQNEKTLDRGARK